MNECTRLSADSASDLRRVYGATSEEQEPVIANPFPHFALHFQPPNPNILPVLLSSIPLAFFFFFGQKPRGLCAFFSVLMIFVNFPPELTTKQTCGLQALHKACRHREGVAGATAGISQGTVHTWCSTLQQAQFFGILRIVLGTLGAKHCCWCVRRIQSLVFRWVR